MMETAPEESIDQLLDRLEKLVGRLAEAREPIEELVVAYEDGTRLVAEAQARLESLAVAVGGPE
jgi:exodeoxyribonuclease VII small subunit